MTATPNESWFPMTQVSSIYLAPAASNQGQSEQLVAAKLGTNLFEIKNGNRSFVCVLISDLPVYGKFVQLHTPIAGFSS